MRRSALLWLFLLTLPRTALADSLFTVRDSADVPLALAPVLVALTPELVKSSFERPACGGPCDPSAVPAFDRWALGRRSETAARLSDIGLVVLPLAALALDRAEVGGGAFWTDTVVLLQAMSLGALVVELTKLAVRRPRPWVYGEPANAVPTDAEASLSFFSGPHCTRTPAMRSRRSSLTRMSTSHGSRRSANDGISCDSP